MMMSDLTIRQAGLEDYDALCDLYRALDVYHIGLRPDIFKNFEGPVREKLDFIEKVNDPASTLFVAEADGVLCGLVDIEERSSPDYPMFINRHYALIDNLVVAEKYRKQGIARALFKKVKSWALSRNLNQIKLKVYSDNKAALKFYKSLGFSSLTEELELEI